MTKTKANLRFGVLGYTVCWTSALWLGGTGADLVPCFFLAYPIACMVDQLANKIRGIK